MSKGIAQTEGPQLVAKPFVQLGPVQLNAQWKNVSVLPFAEGEGAASVSVSPKLGPFQLGLASPTSSEPGFASRQMTIAGSLRAASPEVRQARLARGGSL